jgi:AraC-like DNA-binding protein
MWRAVGVSPAYLTDLFRRVEGVPLHGYLTQLRLARALVELPNAADLTTLALALGFSSPQSFYGRLSARVRLHPVPVSRVNTPHPLIASRSAWSPDASSTARHNSVQISSPQSARLLDRPIGRARSACRERTGSVPMSSGACRHGKTSGWMPCPHPQSAHAVQCSGVHWRNSQTPLASLTERRG